ncbi:TPA: PBECR4 domain-containing protein [Streptococcus agalactiae]
MASYTKEEREARKNYAKERSIVEVAESLGMELVKSGAEYRWKEHDSMVITPRTNLWHWFSQDKGGDTIELVRTINNISFNQAIDYLNDGDYSEGTLQHNDAPQAFKNYLAPYEQPFVEGRSYLKEVRGLSDETIDFFLDQNVITQANAKIGDTIEPVIVFKTIDHKGEMIGGNLQGIVENRERYDKHGYLKGIMRNSNGNNGLSVDIGSPERLVFAESPIDLMSYYELHKDQLENVRLVSMDGLKDGIIGTNLARLESEMRNVYMRDEDWDRDLLKKSVDDGYFNDGKHADVITLAVDNDQGGRNFIQSLEAKGIVVKAELPAEKDGFEKQDWNDALKEQKATPKHPQDNSRLAQAERKLEPLEEPMTYQAFTEALEQSKQSLTDKLQAGELHVQLDDATYFYQLVRKTGWSHPMQQLSDKGIEALKPYRELFESIKADTIDAYKTKGTPEQDRLYEVLKEVRKKANFPSISTEFTAEMAISAYAVNGDMASLSPDTWAQRTTDPVGTLATNISDVLEYPFNEVSNDAYRNALYLRKGLYDLLNDQEGNYTITPETYQSLMDRGANITLRDDEQEESQEVAQNKVTSPEITQEPALQVLFDFSESREIAALYKNGQVIPYQEFVENLYRENDLPVFGGGYDKTFFSLIDEQGQELTRFRYDVGSETATISEQVSSVLTQDYLRLAEEADSRVTGRVGDTEKAPDQNQEPVGEEQSMSMDNAEQEKKTPEITQEPSNAGEFHRTSDYLGEESPRTASQPVVDEPQPDFPVTAQLYFTTDRARVSNIKPGYRVARAKDMKDLNLFAPTLQSTAQWYLQELADSKIHYVFKDADGQFDKLEVNFQEKNFAHLAGISPVNRTMKETLYDFAEGRGDYPNIQVSKALRSKMKVLPLLPDIVDANSFVFNDLTNIEKLDNLDLSKAIAPEDNDLLVLFKDTAQDGLVPSSLMRVQGEFSQSLQEVERQTVLGVYRERDGKLEQLSINEELSQNDAQKMIDVVRNSLSVEKQKEITPEAFAGVLDAAYNVGRVPLDQVPEEYRAAWERFYELSDEVDGSLDRVVAKADEIGLLKKDTDFYKDWSSDKTYLNNYHVRLQLAEDHEKGAQLPFQEGQIIDYREFVTALYQENQALYDKIQDSAKVALETGEGYIPYTKTKFDVYAPGGRLIKDNVRYDVGDETQPVTRLMGLGARVLDGWEDLDRIDQEVLSQLEKQSPQEELAQGKSNSAPQTEEPYTSEKMAVKQGISDRVREIIAEGSARKTPETSKEDQRVNHSVTVETRLEEPQELDTRQENAPQTFPVEQELDGFSYQTAKAEELSAQAIKAIRSYAANPEDLKEYLDFMSHFTKYSPRNTALIHEQWRGANAVATYKHWEALGKRMGIGPDDVLGGASFEYTNERTGKTRIIKNEGLSVRAGQKGHIKLFKPMMDEMIPVLDETGQQLKNDKGYPKYKPKKKATAAEEEAIKQGRLEVKSFPKRDLKTGKALYKTFTVFELSQTNLKPEKYPNIMPNRHYDFDTDKVKTQEVLLGLKDYADCLGVSIEKVDMKSNVKGQFNKEDQSIQLNDQNTKGEMVGTLIHELAHATLHNPKFKDCYKEEVPKEVKELEAEMTSYVTAKHFGLDTSEKAIPYMANWTDKLSKLSDDELDQSMKRVHETTKKMLKAVEKHTKPLAQRLSPEQGLSQHQNLNPLPPKM